MSNDREKLRDERREPAATHASRAPRTRSKGKEGGLLQFLGLLCAGAGLALSVLPRFSWKANQIMVGFDSLGVHGGTLLMGGLVLMALGLVRRALDADKGQDERDNELLLEQVATDLIHTRTALDELRESTTELAGKLEALREETAAAEARDDAPASQPQLAQDALFSLAASLDKLGARVDQRLKAYHTTVQESLDELASSVEHSRRSLEERLSVAPAPQFAEDSTVYAQPEAELACDAPAAVEPPRGSLGLLDSLDDDPVRSALPAHPNPSGIDFDQLDASTAALTRELDSASRAAQQATNGSWDEQLMVDHGDQDTAAKLEQLQSLLSDERLRAALDSMRRQ